MGDQLLRERTTFLHAKFQKTLLGPLWWSLATYVPAGLRLAGRHGAFGFQLYLFRYDCYFDRISLISFMNNELVELLTVKVQNVFFLFLLFCLILQCFRG